MLILTCFSLRNTCNLNGTALAHSLQRKQVLVKSSMTSSLPIKNVSRCCHQDGCKERCNECLNEIRHEQTAIQRCSWFLQQRSTSNQPSEQRQEKGDARETTNKRKHEQLRGGSKQTTTSPCHPQTNFETGEYVHTARKCVRETIQTTDR